MAGNRRLHSSYTDGAGLSAFSPARPLLLLTDFPPDQKGGGAVILRSLLTPEDRERIVWATMSPLPSGSDRGVVSFAPTRNRSLLRDGTVRTSALRQKARAVVKSCDAAAAWIVAHGAPVRVAPDLIAAGIPVHITVHDDPAWGNVLLTRRYLRARPFARLRLESLVAGGALRRCGQRAYGAAISRTTWHRGRR